MPTKSLFVVVMTVSLLGCTGTIAMADEPYSFAKIDCNPQSDTLEVSELISYDIEGQVQDPAKTQSDDLSNGSAIYNLQDLVTYADVFNDGHPVLSETRTLVKTCRLSAGSFKVKVTPYVYNANPNGMCGAGAPDLMLTVSIGTRVLMDDLVFPNEGNCHDSTTVIDSVLINAKSQTLFVSGSYNDGSALSVATIPVKKEFSLKPGRIITKKELFYSLTQMHLIVLAHYKQTQLPERAVQLLEEAGVQGVLKKRPGDIAPASYVNLLNDYGFFLSETSDRYKEAIPVLQKVIALAPKRHVAYLNLADAYWKGTYRPADATRGELEERARSNYREYVRLLRKKHPEAEVPSRIRKILALGQGPPRD